MIERQDATMVPTASALGLAEEDVFDLVPVAVLDHLSTRSAASILVRTILDQAVQRMAKQVIAAWPLTLRLSAEAFAPVFELRYVPANIVKGPFIKFL